MIIKDLISKGWIRIRKYSRPDRWSVNVLDFSEKTVAHLRVWASKMIDVGWSKYSDVYIDSPVEKKMIPMQIIPHR